MWKSLRFLAVYPLGCTESESCWLPWKADRFLGPLITVCIMDNAIETLPYPCSLSSLLEPHGGAHRGWHAGCEIRGRQMVKTVLRLRRWQHLDAYLHGAVLWLWKRHISLQVSMEIIAHWGSEYLYHQSHIKCEYNSRMKKILQVLPLVGL